MTTATAAVLDAPVPYLFNVDQYHRMFEAGILHHKVELLGGVVWDSCDSHEPAPMRFTVDQYRQMADLEIIQPEARTELIDGEVIVLPPAGDWHNAGVDSMAWQLRPTRFGDRIIRSQGSIKILASSEPEPDVTVLRFRSDFYREGGATAGDVLLVVEVSDSTLHHDRGSKVAKYAEAGIPEVWIVTREPAVIEVYREPRGRSYADVHVYGRDEVVTSPRVPGAEVLVREITG